MHYYKDVVCLLLVICAVFFSKEAFSGMLTPPQSKILFADDVLEKLYQGPNMLEKFYHAGNWKTVKHGDHYVLVGKSSKTPIYIKSVDTLSNESKIFKFDFSIKSCTSVVAFVYGKSGVVIKDGVAHVANFSDDFSTFTNITKTDFSVDITSKHLGNTVEFSTGYNPLGGDEMLCDIYVNGTGTTFTCPNKEESFGVYIGPQNQITIDKFRWDIGSQ